MWGGVTGCVLVFVVVRTSGRERALDYVFGVLSCWREFDSTDASDRGVSMLV